MTVAPTAEQLTRLLTSPELGPVIMLNLLRFNARATGVDAADGITGEAAYARYAEAVLPHLERAGGRILLALDVQDSVIGPDRTEWDMVVAVEYPSRSAFLAMTSDPDYLANHAHREAALADSRLIACTASPG